MSTTPCTYCTCTYILVYRQFGFQYMLMDLVEAPPPVLSYYCAHQHLHDISSTTLRIGIISSNFSVSIFKMIKDKLAKENDLIAYLQM